MGLVENYITEIKNTFVSHHIFFFLIAALVFQFVDFYVEKYFPIKIYQVATIMSLYSFITTSYSSYDLIVGSIVATFISYFIYNIFVYYKIQKRIYLFNIVTLITVLACMIVGNCLSLPSLAYTLMSYKSIPANKINYLTSLIVASVIIVIISFILLNLISIVNTNILHKEQYNAHFSQVKENIFNWKIF
jgi:H+/Cl- antiporter ClcA